MKQAQIKIRILPIAKAEIARLQKDNLSLQEENHSLREENLKQAQELLYYKRLFYGRRSERRIPDHPDGQLFIPFGQESIPEETSDIKPLVEEIQVASYTRRNRARRESRKLRREEIPADIERRTRVIEPEGIDLEKTTRIGEDVREILHYILCCPEEARSLLFLRR
jgi:hypothetical protein